MTSSSIPRLLAPFRLAPVALVLLALALVSTTPHAVEAAAMVVTTSADDTNVDALCSLREAMTNAGDNAATNVDCPAGDATGDTITFAVGLAGQTITLGSALPDVNVLIGDSVTIDGTGRNITISGNAAVGILTVNGAGTGGATAELRGLTLRDGRGTNAGAIDNPDGTLTLVNTTFIGNNPSVGTQGGAVRSLGAPASLTIRNSTFTGNTASGAGGAVVISGGTATITNSTFSGNTSPAGLGGAIAVASGTVNIANSTISGNTSANGGGLFIAVPVTLSNTIVANNTSPGNPECSGTITNNNVNLIEDATGCTLAGAGTTLNGDPALAALASNGGPVQTFALNAGSPALGAGNAGVCAALAGGAFDARGIARPQGAGCDLGAYEALQVSVAPVAQAEGNGATVFNVPVTLSQALPAGFPSVTVQYDTSNGSAMAPADYTAVVAGTVTFTAGGSATVNATVPVIGNTVIGSSKTFTVTLSNAVRAVIATSSALATITEDDAVVIAPPDEAAQPYIEAPANSTTTTGAPFTLTLRAGDGVGPYRWSLIGGTLPPGVTLDAATAPGTYRATIRALDSRGINADLVVSITVAAGAGTPPVVVPTVPPVSTPPSVTPPVVTPPPTTPSGTFAGTPVFNASGVGSAVFAGGTTAQVEASAITAGARGVWVQDGSGVFHLLVVGGPAFLQAPFLGAFPGGLSGPVAVFLVR